MDIVSALIGLGGAIIGGFIGYFAAMKAARKQIEAAQDQSRADRTRDLISATAPLLSKILASYTVDDAKTNRRAVPKLEKQWELQYKTLYIQGHQDLIIRLSHQVDAYFEALGGYADGDISKNEVHSRRIATREKITEILSSTILDLDE